MKKSISVLMTLLLALPLGAQPPISTQVRPLFALYDLDSATDISGSYGNEVLATGRATTSGSSTTTTSLNTSKVFDSVAVGDIIWAVISGVKTSRVVTAKASADSITVDTAWTLPATGVSIRYQKATIGASSGWVAVDGAKFVTIAAAMDQGVFSTGGISFQIQGRFQAVSSQDNAVNLWPGQTAGGACGGGTYASGYCTFTTAGISSRFVYSTQGIVQPTFIRLVMKLSGTDDGNDLTTNLEQVTATLEVVR